LNLAVTIFLSQLHLNSIVIASILHDEGKVAIYIVTDADVVVIVDSSLGAYIFFF